MRAPVSWLRELVDLDPGKTGADIAADLVRVGLEEEGLHGGDIAGPLVVGRVLDTTDEPQKNGKTIHFCHVDVGNTGQRAAAGGDPAVTQEIVCGAHNFDAGDLVVVVLPGATLPGGLAIGARKTYGHMSNGMICSAAELGLGDDHDGIIVLTEYFADEPQIVAGLEPGQDAIALLGLGDEVVEVNVTPDRGYCFSMRGIARELALSNGVAGSFVDPVGPDAPVARAAAALGAQSAAQAETGFEIRLDDDSPIRGSLGCDRYVARIVRGVDAEARTPSWMKARLTQLGMRPISLAVDITNYLMLLTGQPLHAFDLDRLSGAIEVRRARRGETLRTLDDVERTLDPQDLLITDDGVTPLAIAGVMGGETSEVTAATTTVLIEAAHFEPVTVARSSRRHKLSTEASRRFERGVDPAMTAVVAQLAVDMLVEFGSGTADACVTDVDLRTPRDPFEFDTGLAWALIQPEEVTDGAVPAGLDHEAVVAALRAIGCVVTEEPQTQTTGGRSAAFGVVQVLPASWRPDLADGPDLVEEVARLRGYDEIPAVLPAAPSGRGLTRAQRAVRRAGATLAGLGLIEVWSYPFVGEAVFDRLGLPPTDRRRSALGLANPLSDELPLMRTSILETLLDTLRMNVRRGNRDLGIFEIGLVVRPEGAAEGNDETARSNGGGRLKAPVPPGGRRPDEATMARILRAVPRQPRHLAMALAGDAQPAGPWGAGRAHDAGDAIGLAVQLGRSLGVELAVHSDEHSPWHPGRCAALRLPDGSLVGHAGELHPKVVAAFEIPARTCAVELDLDALIAARGGPVQVATLSTLPVAHTDVALVVDDTVPAGHVETALRQGAGSELESLHLFDVYRGEQVGPGKKSLAYRLTFRPELQTLKTEQVSALRDAAVAAATSATGAVQRGA